jgi:hypothetical protein
MPSRAVSSKRNEIPPDRSNWEENHGLARSEKGTGNKGLAVEAMQEPVNPLQYTACDSLFATKTGQPVYRLP